MKRQASSKNISKNCFAASVVSAFTTSAARAVLPRGCTADRVAFEMFVCTRLWPDFDGQ